MDVWVLSNEKSVGTQKKTLVQQLEDAKRATNAKIGELERQIRYKEIMELAQARIQREKEQKQENKKTRKQEKESIPLLWTNPNHPCSEWYMRSPSCRDHRVST